MGTAMSSNSAIVPFGRLRMIFVYRPLRITHIWARRDASLVISGGVERPSSCSNVASPVAMCSAMPSSSIAWYSTSSEAC